MKSMKVKSMFGSLKRRGNSQWARREAVLGVLAKYIAGRDVPDDDAGAAAHVDTPEANAARGVVCCIFQKT